MIYPTTFDVIVVGGGHAGTEAALAAARMGCNTLLLTHNIETLGQMSCNPSIGGIGKGHLVKEVDALGGAMALATDIGGIQFRTLNASKGPAVRATRAQADRVLYKAAIREMLENQPNLTLFQQPVDDLLIEGDRVAGAITAIGITFRGKSVVLTAGTFLSGKIHVGLENYSGGRAGDAAASTLGERLRELNLPVGRLKTGTPPRIDGRSIDFAHQMALADAADRRVAAHRPEGVEIVRQQQRLRPHPCGRQRGLGTGVAATNHNDIKTGGIKHGTEVLFQAFRGLPQCSTRSRILRQGAEKSKFLRTCLYLERELKYLESLLSVRFMTHASPR